MTDAGWGAIGIIVVAGLNAVSSWRAGSKAASAEKTAGEAKQASEAVSQKTDDQTATINSIDAKANQIEQKADVASAAAQEAAHNTNSRMDECLTQMAALNAELVNAKATIAAQNKLLEMLTNARRADDRVRLEPPKPEPSTP